MIDIDRLCRMIALARYQKKNEDKGLRLNKSYEQDYVSGALIRNFVLTTIAYALVLIVAVLYNLDIWLSNLSNLNLRPLLATLIVSYLITLGIFSVIAYVVARLRYTRMGMGIRQYRYELEQLRKSYRAEDEMLRWNRKNKKGALEEE